MRMRRAGYEEQMNKKMSDDERAELVEEITAITGKDYYSSWTKWMLANEAVGLGIRPASLLKLGYIDGIRVNDDNRARVVEKLTEKTGLDYSAWSNDQLYNEAHFVGIFPL